MDNEVVTARLPRRPRGHVRFEAILAAAAEILIEQGVGGVTMQAVAKRSCASVGSMYHFFKDRDALLVALRERELAPLSEILDQLRLIGDDRWRAMSAHEVMTALFGGLAEYLLERPRSLPFLIGTDDEESTEHFYLLVERVLELRSRDHGGYDASSVTAVLFGAGIGLLRTTASMNASRAIKALSQLAALLAAYLEKIEDSSDR